MKIRTDFVTNASSSSFVAFGIYDQALANIVEDLIKKYGNQPKNSLGMIKVTDGVVAVNRELRILGIGEDLDVDETLEKMYSSVDEDFLNEEPSEEDELDEMDSDFKKRANGKRSDAEIVLTLDNVIKSLDSFFDPAFLTPEIIELIKVSFEEGGVEADVFVDETGCTDYRDFKYSLKRMKERRAISQAGNAGEFNAEIIDGRLEKLYGSGLVYVVPNNVSSVSPQAFDKCDALESIIFSDSVIEISNYAFWDAKNIKHVKLPSGLKVLGSSFFKDLTSLESVELNEGLEKIEMEAFSGCTALERIEFPTSLKSVSEFAFINCSALKQVVLHSPVDIASNAFEGCSSLEFNKHDNTLCLGDDENPYIVLYKAIITAKKFDISDTTKAIAHAAFFGAKNFTEIKIPNSVVHIYNYAFAECKKMKSICLPPHITRLAKGLFNNCAALENLILPDGIVDIEKYVFDGCDELELNEFSGGLYLGTKSNPYHALICPESATITSCELHKDTVVIAAESFWKYEKLTSIKFNDAIKTIPEYMMRTCKKLKYISLPKSLKRIDLHAFEYCSAIEEIFIPDGTLSIGKYAFWRCKALKSVTIPSSVVEIEEASFKDCPLLVINGKRGSSAELYAKENNIPFKAI